MILALITLVWCNEERHEQVDRTIVNTNIDVNTLNQLISRDEVLQAVIHAQFHKASGIDNYHQFTKTSPFHMLHCNHNHCHLMV